MTPAPRTGVPSSRPAAVAWLLRASAGLLLALAASCASTTRGQPVDEGTFKLRLLEAYDARCAVTGERVVPVLDAAHIQPYLGPASNHVQNGLLLRTDLHRLYDEGLLGVTPDYSLRVSERIHEEWENGKDYYALEGRAVRQPTDSGRRASRDALAWHLEAKFR
jgi:putative restriction endonuclease